MKKTYNLIYLLFILTLNFSCIETKPTEKEINNPELSTSKTDNLKFGSGIGVIWQGPKGKYWFGIHKEGKSKYDGNEFKNFTINEGWSDNQIRSKQEDKNGNILIATAKGLSIYDGHKSINYSTNTIYSKSYGQSKNPAIIFLHGGPRGNSTLFEGTTAEKLAEKGYYVIVYDRRGEGRSIDTTANFTFREAINDLNYIYKRYNINKANIIAHSFGGLVGTLFTEQNPEKVNSLILVGGLFSQQETYDHILKTTKKIYSAQKDSLILSKISEIEKLSKNTAEYRQECYEVASKSNFFKMPFPTKEADQLREDYEKSEFGKNNIRNDNAPILFYKNESKNNIDTKSILKKLKPQIRLFAIYGQQDQIFSEKQLNDLKKIVKKQNFKVIDNCSHYPFVDQQTEFINAIVKWIQ